MKFYECMRKPRETVSHFLENLRTVAETCDFAQLKEVDDPCEEMANNGGLSAGLWDVHI